MQEPFVILKNLFFQHFLIHSPDLSHLCKNQWNIGRFIALSPVWYRCHIWTICFGQKERRINGFHNLNRMPCILKGNRSTKGYIVPKLCEFLCHFLCAGETMQYTFMVVFFHDIKCILHGITGMDRDAEAPPKRRAVPAGAGLAGMGSGQGTPLPQKRYVPAGRSVPPNRRSPPVR